MSRLYHITDTKPAELVALATALGFNYGHPTVPVSKQGITIGDVHRALAAYPALGRAVPANPPNSTEREAEAGK